MSEPEASVQTTRVPRSVGQPPKVGRPRRRVRPPLLRALREAVKVRPSDLCSLAQVTAVVVFVELAVRTVPLARLAGWLGVTLRLSDDEAAEPAGLPEGGFGPGERRKARLARRLLAHWPFGAGPCLRESLVIGHVLRRHGPALRLGVARDGQAIAAHAWLEVGGVSLEADRGFLPLGR